MSCLHDGSLHIIGQAPTGNSNQICISVPSFTPIIYQLYLGLQTTLLTEAMKEYLIILKERD